MKKTACFLIAVVLMAACGGDPPPAEQYNELFMTPTPAEQHNEPLMTTTRATTETVYESVTASPQTDRSSIVFNLPDNPADWQTAYVDYLNGDFEALGIGGKEQWWNIFVSGLYVKDMDGDSIPDLFIQSAGWNYPTHLLLYGENEIVDNFIYYPTSTSNYALFLQPETERIVVFYGGHNSMWEKIIYYTVLEAGAGGNLEVVILIDGSPEYETFRLDDADVSREEFFAAIDEYITPYEMVDFRDLVFTGSPEERMTYLEENIFY
ncbi:MAG: hypothetical protein FWH08_02585 [Oscillospiraceae bacterium]|nr:hypothetical protein [Oscillospiraceae bacterium]